MSSKILIIEDEAKIARFVELELKHEGYEVKTEFDGIGGLQAAQSWQPDLLVLDLMLPGMSGIEVCRRLRAGDEASQLPILMLTAKDDITDKVMGLDMGADDYMTKPFAIEELLARIRALLKRRASGPKPSPKLTAGRLSMDTGARSVSFGDVPMQLTKTEFDLLECLLRNRGRVLTRDELLEKVWGWSYDGDTNVVDVYIRYLRQKLDEKFDVKTIHTIRGVGYMFQYEET
ncbi:response regulator transcription factor [Eubacteriales bacterium OttesenSCG-928-A19]|nr:response regulator transcription factor [Eubacteriales bacterium OttesenSCG-928-A19]